MELPRWADHEKINKTKRMKQFYLLLCLVCLSFGVQAQIGVGEWRDHLSYTSALQTIEANNKVYCITTGGLFTYDLADNSLQKFNQINGLSDVRPVQMAYGEAAEVVVLAYENSNLDLIFEQEVFNISAIKRKQIQGDKKIYSVLVVGQTAYLSCGFGIVAVNLEKREIKDTYYIGENGTSLRVMDMTFDGTYLYAATESGIYRADQDSPNLQDFKAWVHVDAVPNSNQTFANLEFFDGAVIACYSDESSGQQELYQQNGNVWERIFPGLDKIQEVRACHDRLLVAMNGKLHVYDASGALETEVNGYTTAGETIHNPDFSDAACSADGTLWLADAKTGLVRKQGGNFDKLIPVGPSDNRVFSMLAHDDDLWVTSGGRTDIWNNVFNAPEAKLFRSGEWSSFSRNNIAELNDLHDIVNVVIDPTDPDHVFLGSWGGGVVELREGAFEERFNQFNSSLQSALPDDNSPNFVRIGGMAFDSKNNLWVTNSLVGRPLSVYTAAGSWESFTLEDVEGVDVGEIVITPNDDKWIIIPRGRDLYVRKGDGSAGKHLKLISYFNNGEQEDFNRMNDVYSIAVDQEGAIWVGTSEGVAVYFNPEDVWDGASFYATQPGLDLNDGVYHPLLETETVTAIAVDGGNRKWLGTRSSGVFLVSEDGQNELKNFNVSNSPLLSNSIQSIAVNDKTGEVFFGTPEGIISYRGEATQGGQEYADVYAFPNPVRETYEGDIVITGLIADTDVKITDISGNLVHETTSVGGQAVWDGKNLNGKRVSTGVYLVLGNDKSGEKTFSTKILFIH
ncbi:putative secreted protein (Por secretion system target) [Sunxiuqinia elliptica]|uniref:Putative secreted protein (Por secretion system target) n=2 Tax=Sunxiuqinia elliptica TaxID=655355 RepID=A0A4R6H3Y0_9BACT|nr:putative secreted protein (Por secretion system target) [Sunxiuqinia elliptica]TDO58459.1 putative secreted protein (Por secretion system target) [Sunxiuqinia elliptica]